MRRIDLADWPGGVAGLRSLLPAPLRRALERTADRIRDDLRAAEHRKIVTRDAEALSREVRHAGAIFLGAETVEPIGDYIADPSHVLPADGTASYASPLGGHDFVERTPVFRSSSARMAEDGAAANTIAEAEGLFGYAASVRRRMGE